MMRNLLLIAMAMVLASGCGNPAPKPSVEDEEGEEHHVHSPMFGGELMELGEHQANLEFTADTTAGTVTVYVLDAHAEHPVRLADKSLQAELMIGGEVIPITLNAMENVLTGETVGDTAQFTGKHDALVGAQQFSLRISAITVRGLPFKNITWTHGKN
ncbi:MAG: hypothetical protein IT368_17280 [Candidatus Hydrogenedentes bacterium]|nr:hypothetical protein [Candidatus Hydrogenedentota bacterium]